MGLLRTIFGQPTEKRRPLLLRNLPLRVGPKVVARDTRSLLRQRGWKRDASGWVGTLRTPAGSFASMIQPQAHGWYFYIKAFPLKTLLSHTHARCVSVLKENWVRIHIDPRSYPREPAPDDVLKYAEIFLAECIMSEASSRRR